MPLLAALAAGAAAVYGWGRAVAAAAAEAFSGVYDWNGFKATQILDNPDPAASDRFGRGDGHHISHDNNTIIVGVFDDDDTVSGSGSGYVYTKSDGVWSNVAKLKASDPASSDNLFWSARISGDGNTVVAGIDYGGKVYIYSKPESGWTNATETQKITGTSVDSSAIYFGHAVSISEDGSTIAVGAYGTNSSEGAVYIFTESGGTWSYQAKLTASDGATSDTFGRHIDITSDGNTIAIGAANDDDNSTSASGSVYIFTRSGSTWSQRDKITAETNIGTNDKFGWRVSISNDGNTLAVATDNAAGSTDNQFYVFTYDEGSSSWSQEAEITYGDALAAAGSTDLEITVVDTAFGNYPTISGDGNTISVAAPFEKDPTETYRAGAVYIFTRSNGTWQFKRRLTDEVLTRARDYYFGENTRLSNDGTHLLAPSWIETVNSQTLAGRLYIFEARAKPFWEDGSLTETLTEPSGNYYDTGTGFGASATLSGFGDYAVIGATSFDEDPFNQNAGRSYIFKRSGSTWSQQAELQVQAGPDSTAEQMGHSSAISYNGDTVAISQHNEDAQKGTVQVFTRSGTTWSHQAELQPTDLAAGDRFGQGITMNSTQNKGVAISDDGNVVVVAAIQHEVGGVTLAGAVYVFRRTGSSWSQEQKFTVSPNTSQDAFGSSVAISGDGKYIIAGAYSEDGDSADSYTSAGAAYVFKKSETANTWTQQARFTADPLEATDFFGIDVGINYDGTKIVVGAHYDEFNTTSSGAAYIFTRSLTGTSWSREAKIGAFDAAATDLFGNVVDMSADGNVVAIGAIYDDDGATSSGSIYIYNRYSGAWQLSKKISGTATTPTNLARNLKISSDGMYIMSGNINDSEVYIYKAGETPPAALDWSTGITGTFPTSTLVPAMTGIYETALLETSAQGGGITTQIGSASFTYSSLAVSENGNIIVGGAPNSGQGDGQLQLIYKLPGSAYGWSATTLSSPSSDNTSSYGDSVAISYNGKRIFATRPKFNFGKGEVYVYDDIGSTSPSWSRTGPITQSSQVNQDYLGEDPLDGGKAIACSHDGKMFVVGAYQSDYNGTTNAGQAFVFTESNGTWTQTSSSINPGSYRLSSGHFGHRLDMSGDGRYIIAGMYTYSSNRGSAFIFTRAEGSNSWSQEQFITGPVSASYFGRDVAIDQYGSTAVIGADRDGISSAGKAYVYIRNGSNWTKQAELEASDKASSDYFGYSVAISANGNEVVIGAPGDGSTGSTYVFTRDGTTWTQQYKITQGTAVGYVTHISPTGETVLVGDPSYLSNTGRFFIYQAYESSS